MSKKSAAASLTEVLRSARQLLRPSRDFVDVFGGCGEEDWAEFVLASTERRRVRGCRFPGFPPDEVQKATVGRCGREALLQASGFYKRVVRHARAHLAAFGPDTRVCDFGCGWGRIIRFFLKDVRAHRLVGLDPSEELLEASREAFAGTGVRFEKIPRRVPYEIPSDSFDLVFAYSVFSHLREDAFGDVFRELHRVLSPGGVVVFTSRGRYFLERSLSLRGQNSFGSPRQEQLATMFTEDHLARYGRGEFVWVPLPDAPAGAVFGEAAVPAGYVRDELGGLFRCVEFSEECPDEDMDQTLFVLTKR